MPTGNIFCRFFSYGLEKNFRQEIYEEFEKKTLQVSSLLCCAVSFVHPHTYAHSVTSDHIIF